jgi:hypothetical protein
MILLLLQLSLLPSHPGPDTLSQAPREYRCWQTDSPPSIDGSLAERAWDSAQWSSIFVDIEGDRRPPPRLRTRMKMLWDREFLYIGAELEEPDLWGRLRTRDTVIYQDNDFEVFLDPDGDRRNYVELELNVLNTCWDLFLARTYRDGGHGEDGYDIRGLLTSVRVDGTLNDPRDRDRGWSVEIAIPWTGLGERSGVRSPPRVGDRWRVNFSRVEWDLEVVDRGYRKIAGRPEHNWVWSPQWTIDMHLPERWGFVEFAGRGH